VRRDLPQQRDVLAYGRGQHDEVGIRHRREILGRHVDRPPRQPLAQHRLPIDGQHVRRRPGAPRSKRNRSADEPQADDGDARKNGRGSG